MIPIALTILALAGQNFLTAHCGSVETANDIDVKAFCADQPLGGGPLTPAQVGSLATKIDQHQECSPIVQEAVRRMADVVEATRDNACDLDAIGSLKELHRDHMAAALVDGSVPAAFEKFFLSYALRMSQRCKERMVEALSGDAYEALDKDDLHALHDWIEKGGSLDDLLKVITRPGTLVLPSDLSAILPGMDEQINKLAINSAMDKDVQMVKTTCEKRLTPVYKKLVDPVAELARAGFDYPDTGITGKLSREQVDKVDEWARIVFTCEVLNMVETFKESSKAIEPESVMIVDEDSIASIENELEHEAKGLEDLETVHYEPRVAAVKMGAYEQVDERELNKLATDLTTYSSPVELMRESLREKALELMAPYLAANNELDELVTCLSDADGAHEKALCGRRRRSSGGGVCEMFKFIFIAAIIGFMMMLIAGGG